MPAIFASKYWKDAIVSTLGTDLNATKNGHVGVIALNRPKARNALSLDMVDAFTRALERFQSDPEVSSVIVKSEIAGTFSAGGDVRAIYFARKEGQHEEADAFFEREFALNEYIASYPKPYVSLINGNCFGGGMGISIHGQHRIVGEGAVLAMPETAIGYFPDVGASYFLNQVPLAVARFLGLSGYLISPGDAMFTGLATAYVPGARHADIEAGLAAGIPGKSIIMELAEMPGESLLAENVEMIERCFSLNSIQGIKMALSKEAGDFAEGALSRLEYAAPSSLVTTIELLERAKGMSLAQCLAIELPLAKELTRGSDFTEGIRALLVDKDRNPKWMQVD